MELKYKNPKWDKEIHRIERFYNQDSIDINHHISHAQKEFQDTGCSDFLRLYFSMSMNYSILARDLYLLDVMSTSIVDYIYLSGICKLIVELLFDMGMRSDAYTNNEIENLTMDDEQNMCLQFIATNRIPHILLKMEKENIVIKMYNRDYEGAIEILKNFPDDPDDSREVYYDGTVFLKKIYMAIINKNEKAFNEEIEKRIKKYRKNMVGYSTIVDYVSIALIKLAEREGIHCSVDVIEIPKQFFDKELLGKIDIHDLIHYDELMKSGMLDRFEL